jgi:hypothetical protein
VVLDFKQNIKLGGGPIEISQVFYDKRHISTLGFAVIFKDENNKVTTKYVDMFSEILTHDSLYVTDCINILLSKPYMQGFNQICFWSDCGLHFRSAELMNHVLKTLPFIYPQKNFIWNYFNEYHGKNLVDGHFGLLSRWLKDFESSNYINTIEDVVNVFNYKLINSNTDLDIDFIIYRRNEPRQDIVKLKIMEFKSYLSFTHLSDDVLASTTSNLDFNTYIRVNYQITSETDECITKFTPAVKEKLTGENNIMGSGSRQVLLTRIKNTWNSSIPLRYESI